MTDRQPEGTELAAQLGDAVGGPEVPADPETEAVDLRRKLGEATRLGQSWAMESGIRREDGLSLLSVLGDEGAPACGVALIRAERLRQVAVKGYTPEHDAEHADGELAMAAAAYLTAAAGATEEHTEAWWPWEAGGFKPGPKPLGSLVKAGALICAELDRLMAQEAETAAAATDASSPRPALRSPVAEATDAGEGKDGTEEERVPRLCPTCLHGGVLERVLERAEAAEGKLADLRSLAEGLRVLASNGRDLDANCTASAAYRAVAGDMLAITGSEKKGGTPCDRDFDGPVL